MYNAGLLYCVLTTVCWATGPLFVRKGLDALDNTEISALRGLGSFAVPALMCVIINPSLMLWKYGLNTFAAVFIIMFFDNFIGDFIFITAIDNLGVGKALSTANSYPVFVVLFSIWFLGEEPSVTLWTGVAIITAGVTLLNCCGKKAHSPEGNNNIKPRNNKLGFFMAILASVLWASSMTMQKWMLASRGVEALSFALWRGAFLTLATWLFWYFRKSGPQRKHIVHAGIICLSPFLAGAVSLALGGTLFAYALKTIPVSVASPIAASSPVLAAVIARFAFNEKLSPLQWLGIVMVIIGGIKVSS